MEKSDVGIPRILADGFHHGESLVDKSENEELQITVDEGPGSKIRASVSRDRKRTP